MELSRYKELKDKGGATLQRLGPDTFQIIVRNYEQNLGDELPPELVPVNAGGVDQSIQILQERLTGVQKELDALQALKDEMTALDAAAPRRAAPTTSLTDLAAASTATAPSEIKT